MNFELLVLSTATYLLCAMATLRYPARSASIDAPSQYSSHGQRHLLANEPIEPAIALHVFVLMLATSIGIRTSDSYHIDFAYLALFGFLVHAFLFRIKHNFSYWVERSFIFLEGTVVLMEAWAAFSAKH